MSPINPTTATIGNPLVPVSTSGPGVTVPGQPLTGATSTAGISPTSVVPGAASGPGTPAFTPGTNNAINPDTFNQLHDIYGGVGDQLGAFEGSIAGTDSAALQEFIQSLAPQEATAQANTNASLGAGGVSANSSVAAIADSNLQAQEFAAISGEAEKLTENDQSLTANLIESTLPSAEKQVADSNPLNILGSVLGDVGSIASDVMGLGAVTGGASSLFKSGFGGASSVPTSIGGYGTPQYEG